jgi:hypothetical protein
VALRTTSTVASRAEPIGSVVTATDIRVANQTLVPKGTPIAFDVTRQAARRLMRPGSVAVTIHGVRALDGTTLVPLSASVVQAGRGSAAHVALLPVMWMKGEDVSLAADTLVMASVTANVVLAPEEIAVFRGRLPEPIPGSPLNGVARLHLYAVSRARSVSLDGRRLGTLGPNHYACWRVAPGPHILRLGNAALPIDLQADAEHYVKLGDSLLGSLLRTDGYLWSPKGSSHGVERDAANPVVMRPANGLANQVPCW